MRTLSIDLCSAIGAISGVAFAILMYGFPFGRANAQAKANWRRLRPEDSDLDVDRGVARMWRDAGRTLAEYFVLDRVCGEGRVQTNGMEHLMTARSSGQAVLLVGVHLGNWEVALPLLKDLKFSVMVQPPLNPCQRDFVHKARCQAGAIPIPAWPGGMRQMLRALNSGPRSAILLVDEFVGGKVCAPFFGRQRVVGRNLSNAVRLAVASNALVVPAYVVRKDGARFEVNFRQPMQMSSTNAREEAFQADVQRLNDVFEPIVRDNLSQWFWLPNFTFDDGDNAVGTAICGPLTEGPVA